MYVRGHQREFGTESKITITSYLKCEEQKRSSSVCR